MEVTRHNFAQVLPEIESSLNDSVFIALDGEFTGIDSGHVFPMQYDTPSEYYHKLIINSLDFLLIQLGLAIFKYDQARDKYTYKAYSFYLFPKPFELGEVARDTLFRAQASSLAFLAKNNFDFNKAFREGITYLNRGQQRDVINDLARRRKQREYHYANSRPQKEPPPVPEELTHFVQSACDEVERFLRNDTLRSITLPKYNNYMRRIVLDHLKAKFGSLIYEYDYFRIVVSKKDSEDERLEKERERLVEEEAQLKEAIGFTHLIEAISKSRKPLIGHNFMLDLCHTIGRFLGPLPKDYEEFKALVHSLFPSIVDTKHLAWHTDLEDHLHSTALHRVYEAVKYPPFENIKLEEESTRVPWNYSIDEQHDAGFDATVTGIMYICLTNFLGSLQTPPIKPVFPDNPILSNYTNIVYLANSKSIVDLEKPEVLEDRSHIFYMKHPQAWKSFNISELFKSCGDVKIHRLGDEVSCVTLEDKAQAALVPDVLADGWKAVNHTYSIIPWEDHIKVYMDRKFELYESNKFNGPHFRRQTTKPPFVDFTKTRTRASRTRGGGWKRDRRPKKNNIWN